MGLMKTYLPIWSDPRILWHICDGDYAALAAALDEATAYERAGVDRVLAIISDLAELGIRPPARVLDVGCNTGLFSLTLGLLGYRVVGVDDNMAAQAQGWYPEPPLLLARQSCEQLGLTHVSFMEADVATVVRQSAEPFDICLLLSVTHQWFQGYASTPLGAKTEADITATLRNIANATRAVLYFEGPEHEVDASKVTLPLPDWFLQQGLFAFVRPLSISATALGDLRQLYRLTRDTTSS